MNNFIAVASSFFFTLRVPKTSPLLLYILSKDLSVFSIDFFTGDHSLDLGRTKSKEIHRFPDSSGLLFNHTFGKTLRAGSTHLFSTKRKENRMICPVQNFMLYLRICHLIRIDISRGYVFRTTTKVGHVSDKPFTGSTVYTASSGI